MVVFASLNRHSPLIIVLVALALSGVGMGLATPSVSASVANAVDDQDLGIAAATQQLMTQIGSAAGIQVLSTVQASRLRTAGLIGSFSEAYVVGAVAAVLGLLFAVGIRRETRARGAGASGASDASGAADAVWTDV
jgi:MFS family permease